VTDVAPKDRDIAMVFQSYALYPHMDVFDNMAFPLKMRKMKKDDIRKQVEPAAKTLGIYDLLDRKPRQLSGGQRQRVALGRALVREPAVFLMDEPLSNLDAKMRVEMRAELSRLHERLDATFIYVTHDQVEAMTMGTRIAVMNDGIVQQLASPQELFDAPVNQFVAGFIGSPEMNFFPASLTGSPDDIWVTAGACRVPMPKERHAALAPYLNKDVLFGIRPQSVYDKEYAPPEIACPALKVKVDVREPLGSEVLLHLLTEDDQQFMAQVDARSEEVSGDFMEVVFDMHLAHVFDPESGVAIR
jgi:multiple sugar transport system ATP-binding protein